VVANSLLHTRQGADRRFSGGIKKAKAAATRDQVRRGDRNDRAGQRADRVAAELGGPTSNGSRDLRRLATITVLEVDSIKITETAKGIQSHHIALIYRSSMIRLIDIKAGNGWQRGRAATSETSRAQRATFPTAGVSFPRAFDAGLKIILVLQNDLAVSRSWNRRVRNLELDETQRVKSVRKSQPRSLFRLQRGRRIRQHTLAIPVATGRHPTVFVLFGESISSPLI
jgi:hypothetical protein